MPGKVDRLAILFVFGLSGCGSEDASALAGPVVESSGGSGRKDPVDGGVSLSEEEREAIFLRLTASIYIDQPPEGSTVYARDCVVEGLIRYPGKIRSVRAAGQELTYEEGRFHGHVHGLEHGTNAVTVEVEEERGVVAHPSVIITVDAEPPKISLDEPREGQTLESPVLVRGRVRDDSLFVVELGGKKLPLDPDGSFECSLALEPGSHSVEVIARDPGRASRVVRHVTVRHVTVR